MYKGNVFVHLSPLSTQFYLLLQVKAWGWGTRKKKIIPVFPLKAPNNYVKWGRIFVSDWLQNPWGTGFSSPRWAGIPVLPSRSGSAWQSGDRERGVGRTEKRGGESKMFIPWQALIGAHLTHL